MHGILLLVSNYIAEITDPALINTARIAPAMVFEVSEIVILSVRRMKLQQYDDHWDQRVFGTVPKFS